MLMAAIKAGADAVYFGIKGFNMRAAAANFSAEELPEIIGICHKIKVKAYCTLNIIFYENELPQLEEIVKKLKEAEIDAVICWDLAVIKACRKYGIEVHLSTQASVANSEAAKLWKEFGVKRIVLARECHLEQIKEIKDKTGLEIEVFVHGARCISLSGRCFMSQELFNKSANRGDCFQPCRREYLVTDEEGKQMKLENNFIMSAKDLCALPLLPELIKLGVDSFKIEGRNRGAEYVSKVVAAYREAINAVQKKKFSKRLIGRLTSKLEEVYNKGFSRGFLVDYPYHQRSDVYGSKATLERVQIGKISNFYKNKKVAEFKVETEGFAVNDRLGFVGNKTGYQEEKIKEIWTDSGKVRKAQKGDVVSIKVSDLLRENDKVFLLKRRKDKE